MKYLIIGAGGTGACIGGYLAKNKKNVTFIARGKHLEALKEKGLTIYSKKHGTLLVQPINAYTMKNYTDTPDVIFVCVKYYALDEVCTFINQIATSNTLVIPILNVINAGQVIRENCPNCTVLNGCIYIMSMIKEPGVIIQPAEIFKVYFGYSQNQAPLLKEKARQVEMDLNTSHIEGYLTPNIMREALQKFSFVSPMGVAGLYYHATGGDFMIPGEKQDTFIALVEEVEKLGNAMGITFEHSLKEVNLKILYDLDKDSTTSMQRDISAGGASEIDGLLHCIVRLAKEYHITLPNYEKISNWAKANNIQ